MDKKNSIVQKQGESQEITGSSKLVCILRNQHRAWHAREIPKPSAKGAAKEAMEAASTGDGTQTGASETIDGTRAMAAIGAKCANAHPIFRASARKERLVGSKCPQGYITTHHAWGGSQFVFTRQFVKKGSGQITTGGAKGAPSFTGVFRGWSGVQKPTRGDQTLGPMVCNFKGGKWTRKTSANCRLSGDQSILSPPTFQTGPLAGHFPFSPKRDVGSNKRFEACLFSLGPRKGFATLCENASSGGNIWLPSGLFRNKHLAPKMDASDEGLPKIVETKRNFVFRVLGRHFDRQQHTKRRGEGFEVHT